MSSAMRISRKPPKLAVGTRVVEHSGDDHGVVERLTGRGRNRQARVQWDLDPSNESLRGTEDSCDWRSITMLDLEADDAES